MLSDDGKTDENDIQMDSSGQNKDAAFEPITGQNDSHDSTKTLDVPQVDGTTDKTTDRTDRLEDNMRSIVDMQRIFQDQIQGLVSAIAPLSVMKDELASIQAEIRALDNQNRLNIPANAHRTEQFRPSQISSVQTGQPAQSGNDSIRPLGSVNNQAGQTLANSTFDYPPPSPQEGAVSN